MASRRELGGAYRRTARRTGRFRLMLLAGGALIAGLGLFMRSGSGGPSTEIKGEPLDPKAAAEEAAKFQALAEPATPAPKPEPKLDVNLDKLELVGDHYEAPLADGRRAILTLDPELQQLAEKLLDQSRAPRGAIVAMAPDGRILALAGRRTEEPKGSTTGTKDWRLATDVWAPAASIFKLVTASALVVGGHDPEEKVCYHGGLRSVLPSNLEDSKRDSNCETLGYGVAKSNNAIVGKLAYKKLEPITLEKLARDFGLDAEVTGASLGVHATCGELSLPKTKDIEFAKAAAGFSGSRLSVLGGAILTATFAGDGLQPEPRLVAKIDGVDAPKPAAAHRVISEKVAKQVGKMMVATCDMGSAVKSFGKRRPIKVAGKTGTLSTNKPFFMEHSWFVGYAPVENPQIIVSVLLGNPESWHLRGHEAAKRMIDRAVRRSEDHDGKSHRRPEKRS